MMIVNYLHDFDYDDRNDYRDDDDDKDVNNVTYNF